MSTKEHHELKFRGTVNYPEMHELLAKGVITGTEFALIPTIDSLVDCKGEGCWASNEYLAKLVNTKTRQLQYMLNHLIELGLIRKVGWIFKAGRNHRVLETKWSRVESVCTDAVDCTGSVCTDAVDCTSTGAVDCTQYNLSSIDRKYSVAPDDSRSATARQSGSDGVFPDDLYTRPSTNGHAEGHTPGHGTGNGTNGNSNGSHSGSAPASTTTKKIVETHIGCHSDSGNGAGIQKNSKSHSGNGNGNGHAQVGTFLTGATVKEQTMSQRCAHHFYNFLKSKDQLDAKSKIPAWVKEFSALLDWRKDEAEVWRVLTGYIKHFDEEFMPVAYCAKKFHEKYMSIKTRLEKIKEQDQDEPDYEVVEERLPGGRIRQTVRRRA